jgi:hypothetical protein
MAAAAHGEAAVTAPVMLMMSSKHNDSLIGFDALKIYLDGVYASPR